MISDFEFTIADFDKEVNTKKLNKKIESLIRDIVKEQFPNSIEKSTIRIRGERVNFACPFCGDSATDYSKKRGNIYIPNGKAKAKTGYYFKCFNCGKYCALEQFLTDFGKSLSGNELIHVKNSQADSVKQHHNRNVDNSIYDLTILEKYAIEKEDIFKNYGLVALESKEGSWAKKYLVSRCQYGTKMFGWDPKYVRLFIFNLTKGGKILGFQVRNFKSEPKYVTHTLEMIYEHLQISYEKTKEFEEVNRFSYLFGICTVDFQKPIFVTEGPLDSMLLKNGISYCGIDNDLPFESKNLMYIYDKDKPGTEKACKMLQKKQNVFLWKKFLKDLGIENGNKKWDITDIFKWSRETEKEIPSLLGYFGNEKMDIWYL